MVCSSSNMKAAALPALALKINPFGHGSPPCTELEKKGGGREKKTKEEQFSMNKSIHPFMNRKKR
jgi:hypothetical protein